MNKDRLKLESDNPKKGLIFQSPSSCLALKHEQLRSPVTHTRIESGVSKCMLPQAC